MIRIFKKEELLNPLIIVGGLNGKGVADKNGLVLRLEEKSTMESDPDPNSIKMIKVNNYEATLYVQNLENDPSPFDIQNISLGDKKISYFILPGSKFIKFTFKEKDIDDITIEWIDKQHERNKKLSELDI